MFLLFTCDCYYNDYYEQVANDANDNDGDADGDGNCQPSCQHYSDKKRSTSGRCQNCRSAAVFGRGGRAPVTSISPKTSAAGSIPAPASRRHNNLIQQPEGRPDGQWSRSETRITCCQLRLILVTFNGHAEGL